MAPREERPTMFWVFSREFAGDITRLFQSLDSIGAAARSANDGLLFWTVEFIRLESQKYFRYKTVYQHIDFLKSRLPFMEQSPYPVARASFYQALGKAYKTNFNFPESAKFLLQARKMFEQIGYQDVPSAPEILDDYFFFHYYLGDYRRAIEYSELAEKYNEPELRGAIYLLSNRKEAYMRMRDYEKAKALFLRAMALAEARSKKPFLGIANGNYGNALRLQGRYAEALPFLLKDKSLNEEKVPGNTAITCLYLSYCLLKQDSVAKAKFYINRSLRLVPVTYEQNIAVWHLTVYGENYFEVQSLYAQKTGALAATLR